jgi:glutamate--cysteine ligase
MDGKKIKQLLAERIVRNQAALQDWQASKETEACSPFYSSIDLRDSGSKIVPVDSNLFPAGFNNICPEDLRAAPPVFRAHLERVCACEGKPVPRTLLVLPESHTQNRYYIENLFYLCQIIQNAGFDVRIGWYGEAPAFPVPLVSATGKELRALEIRVEGTRLEALEESGRFVPDLILLNNDFSGGYPERLAAVEQPIIPSPALGWHTRKKSEHFRYYNLLAGEFARLIDVDPWIVQIDTVEVTPVLFDEEKGTDRVAEVAAQMLERLRARHVERGIRQAPFVFVKNNAGTYGMGIMVVRDAEELRQMNRRTKHKMTVGKGHQAIDSVIVQEGVPTATLVQRLPAEPVIYLFGSELIGGFLRTNTEKGAEENLNSPGMAFKKLCMSDLRDPLREGEPPADGRRWPTLELVYGWVARISALAAGMEQAAHLLPATGRGPADS